MITLTFSLKCFLYITFVLYFGYLIVAKLREKHDVLYIQKLFERIKVSSYYPRNLNDLTITIYLNEYICAITYVYIYIHISSKWK